MRVAFGVFFYTQGQHFIKKIRQSLPSLVTRHGGRVQHPPHFILRFFQLGAHVYMAPGQIAKGADNVGHLFLHGTVSGAWVFIDLLFVVKHHLRNLADRVKRNRLKILSVCTFGQPCVSLPQILHAGDFYISQIGILNG